MKENKQTGSDKGTFRVGDAHPTIRGLFFRSYEKRKSGHAECWQTMGAAESRRVKAMARASSDSGRKMNRAATARYFAENKSERLEESRQYRLNNPEKRKMVCALWKKKNKHLVASDAARRRKTLKESCDQGEVLDSFTIDHIYLYARRLTECTAIKWHVDHVIPVSRGGQHVPTNLQVVPARWNLIKGNKNNNRIKTL